MDKYIPLNKKSKKEQKKYHLKQRNTWGMNPVTRIVPNGKGYDRNKLKAAERKNSRRYDDPTVLFLKVLFSRSYGEKLLIAL